MVTLTGNRHRNGADIPLGYQTEKEFQHYWRQGGGGNEFCNNKKQYRELSSGKSLFTVGRG